MIFEAMKAGSSSSSNYEREQKELCVFLNLPSGKRTGGVLEIEIVKRSLN